MREWMKRYAKFVLVLPAAAIIILILWKIPQWQVRAYHGQLDATAISKLDPKDLIQLQKDLITAENNARLALAQIIGGLVVLLGLYATFKNVRVAEEGKLTERFSKAVEMLSNKDQLNVRLGGIYALERIARDSLKDHWTVMEVLTAFVRAQSEQDRLRIKEERSLISGLEKRQIKELGLPDIKLSEDIQAILNVISRRKWVEQERLHQRIDLSHTFLERGEFGDANLSWCNFSNSVLNGASFFRAKLNLSNFHQANLTEAFLIEANFSGALLASANFTGANMHRCNLSQAVLTWARLTNVDLSAAKGLTWEQISSAIIDQTTKLPPELEERRRQEQAKQSGEASPAAADEAD